MKVSELKALLKDLPDEGSVYYEEWNPYGEHEIVPLSRSRIEIRINYEYANKEATK